MAEKYDFGTYSDNLLLIAKTEFLKEKVIIFQESLAVLLVWLCLQWLIFSKPSNLVSFKVSEIDFPVSLVINEILTFSKYIRIPLI